MPDVEKDALDDEQEWTVEGFIAECDAVTENPPPAPPGFEFIECTATPRHWPLYTAYVDGMYPAHCLFCERDDLSREIRRLTCERDHRRWKSWDLWSRLSSWTYVTGLTASGCGTSFGRCEFCGIGKQHMAPRWRGKRVYILGQPREWWACLRRGHVYTPLEGRTFHLCAKCLPCSGCGSTDPMHRDSIDCPPVENLTFCNFRAPNGLPCTSAKAHHVAAHFTSDGRAWPGTYVLPPGGGRA